jgi:hypothetical protein
MRLTCAQAAKLARLAEGESLPKSELSKSLLLPLQHANVVRFEKSGSSYIIRGIPGKLTRFVEHHWGVRDLMRYAEANPDNRSREMLAEIADDSKVLPTKPLAGIFIRSFGGCFLGDDPLGVTPPGSVVLITLSELPRLRIETKYLIGIENVECLWKFEKVRKHFPHLEGLDYALILRWRWGVAWRQWLSSWTGQMFYFPDYDPAGLRIFATEVLPYRPDTHLLIPQNFETILNERGNRDLYLKQEQSLPLLDEHADIARLCRTLRKARKAFEQEELLF